MNTFGKIILFSAALGFSGGFGIVGATTAMASGQGNREHRYTVSNHDQDYRHHRRYKRYNYGHQGRHHYRHRGRGSWVPFAVIGGLATGYLISKSANRLHTSTTFISKAPYHGGASRPCHIVQKVDFVDGYEVKSAATMCHDARAYPYIVQGSEHVID